MTMMNLSPTQKGNLDDYLATPAIITESMSEEEIATAFNLMCQRTYITRDFVDGKIDPDTFENAMYELGVDIYAAQRSWEDGERFI